MWKKCAKQALLTSTFLAILANSAIAENKLLDWNESGAVGKTWSGWTWFDSASDYGHPGWRKNNGLWASGSSNWLPRIHEKNDYGNKVLGTIDSSERAPSSDGGGSLKVYDSGSSSTYQGSYWFLWDKNFGSQGLADATTNRMSFYFKPTGITSNPNMTGDIANANIHIGTYLCWDGGGLGSQNCPTEANGQHYYHYLTVTPDAWLHVELDRHPTHQRGKSGAAEPSDNPVAGRNYFEYMNSMYVEIRYPQAAPTAYWIDEINLYTTAQQENDISIASVWAGYWPNADKWEIGFNDNSFNSVGYNNSSQSTFEVRYSTSPITNANYAQATVAEPEYWERGTTNTFRRPNSWKKPAWTRFTIPNAIEQSATKIYFAIKDVSSTANGDGHNAPSSLIHTIDYALKPGTGASTPLPTPPKAVANLRIVN